MRDDGGRPDLTPKRGDTVQSVQRCFAMLAALAASSPRGATIADLADQASLSRPVVRRLLLTLESLGYVERSERDWFISPAIVRLHPQPAEPDRLIRMATPRARQLADSLEESAFVCLLERDACRVAVAAAVPRFTTVKVSVGQELPLHATAAGQVLLAWRDELPDLDLTARTERTLRTRGALSDRLCQVRRDGHAVVTAEIEAGVLAAAVPLHDESGEVAASLSTVAPLGRRSTEWARTTALPLLAETARLIEADLTSVTS